MPPSLGAYDTAAHLWPFATLYRNMAGIGLGPVEVRGMTLWEAGAVLGVGFPDEDGEHPTQPGKLSPTLQANVEYHAALARGEHPEPPKVKAPGRRGQEALDLSLGVNN